jgi:hypothetical protein
VVQQLLLWNNVRSEKIRPRSEYETCGAKNLSLTLALLNGAGDTGKGIIRIGTDQPYGSYNKDQYHRQHYRVLGNILTAILRPDPANELSHDNLPAQILC